MQDFHECPYCAEEMEQWSMRFRRTDAERSGGRAFARAEASSEERYGRLGGPALVSGAPDEGLTLLSLCPNERCGYYVLRYRNGLTHWDRDAEAARLLRTVFGDY